MLNQISQKASKYLENMQTVQSQPKFEFIKGLVWRAYEKGQWILFDEINLANEELLMKLH